MNKSGSIAKDPSTNTMNQEIPCIIGLKNKVWKSNIAVRFIDLIVRMRKLGSKLL